MKKIKLTQGFVALVEDEDYERLSEYKWRAQKSWHRRGVYAVTGKCTSMHRFLMGVEDPHIEVDHKDFNGLNNQRYNLRTCSSLQNSRSQRKRRGIYSSKFKGVSWHKSNNCWEARIRCGEGVRLHLGLYDSELEASEIYKFAAEILHGEFACV